MGKLIEILKEKGVEITESFETEIMEVLNQEIGSMSDSSVTDEELQDLKKKYQELEGKYNTDTENFKKQIEKISYDGALELELSRCNAKDTKLIKALIDESKLVLKDGKIEGFAEQLEQIKTGYDYLFRTGQVLSEEKTPPSYIYMPAGGRTQNEQENWKSPNQMTRRL